MPTGSNLEGLVQGDACLVREGDASTGDVKTLATQAGEQFGVEGTADPSMCGV